MSISAYYIIGLRARYERFEPAHAPSDEDVPRSHLPNYSTTGDHHDRSHTLYTVKDVLSLMSSSHSPLVGEEEGEERVWHLNLGEGAVRKLVELPWFGERTGSSISRVRVFFFHPCATHFLLALLSTDASLQFIFDWLTPQITPTSQTASLHLNISYFLAQDSATTKSAKRDTAVWLTLKDARVWRFKSYFYSL